MITVDLCKSDEELIFTPPTIHPDCHWTWQLPNLNLELDFAAAYF